jgi:preprotein translocase subunit SecG
VGILTALLNTLIVIICLFLICLVLIQRGKGGGLAGAFGGVGGSSAFGTKAGDVFTRVTMVVASIWIVLSMLLVVLYNRPSKSAFEDDVSTTVSKEVAPKSSKGQAGSKAKATTSPSGETTAPAGGAPVDVPAIPPSSAPAPATPK